MARTSSLLRKFGVTMVEIIVVVSISSTVLTMAMLLMNRTTRHFKKGTDMLNVQRLMDNIVERIRTDVRSLKRINFDDCTPSLFSFVAIRDGNERTIIYRYDAEGETLFRDEVGIESNFHGARQVKSFIFSPELGIGNRFKFLNVAMQLASDEKGIGKSSTLSIVCQFYSTCVESELLIGNLRRTANQN